MLWSDGSEMARCSRGQPSGEQRVDTAANLKFSILTSNFLWLVGPYGIGCIPLFTVLAQHHSRPQPRSISDEGEPSEDHTAGELSQTTIYPIHLIYKTEKQRALCPLQRFDLAVSIWLGLLQSPHQCPQCVHSFHERSFRSFSYRKVSQHLPERHNINSTPSKTYCRKRRHHRLMQEPRLELQIAKFFLVIQRCSMAWKCRR